MTDQLLDVLAKLLRDLDVPDDDIAAASRSGLGSLIALLADRVLVPGEERLTRIEVATRAGIDIQEASEFWRALGFADLSDEERTFTEADVEVVKRLAQVIRSGIVEPEVALQMTRVMGRSAAQVAAALVDAVRLRVDAGEFPQSTLLAAAPTILEDLDRWVVYVFRRHLAAEAKRAAIQTGTEEAGVAVVGFADLVGFSGITQSLDEPTLAEAVASFEATAVELVGRHDGRTVKMIGDEVMFEAPTAREGVAIALDLVEAFAADEQLPDVRVGLAAGPTIRHQGDLFGTAPNLASRLVEAAYPGTVLVSDAVHEHLGDDDELVFKPVRAQRLKGFGRTKFWVVRRAGEEQPRPAWRRVLPVLKDGQSLLQSIRDAGASD